MSSVDLEAALAFYDEHGYARLGRQFDDAAVGALRERAFALMRGEVVHPGMFFQLDATTGRYEDAPLGLGWQGPSLGYRKLEKLELDEAFRAHLRHPLFERVARARISGPVVLYRAILFNKAEATGGSEVPWHQDGGKLWGLSEDPTLQIWTALDPAPLDGGCLEVVPGSHRRGLSTPLGGVVPKDQVERFEAERHAVALPVEAGEVILLHNHLWHRSRRARVGHRRLAFSACYMSAAVRCLRTRKKPRTFFPVWD